jgi:uncharacterized membrane protein HdeD (DUF308 family)
MEDHPKRLGASPPRWVAAVLGVACVLLGLVLIFRPFASLAVLVLAVGAALIAVGAAELSARTGKARIPSVLAGAGLLVAGVVVVVWPGLSLTALTTVAGIALLVTGTLRLWSSLRGAVEQRLTTAILGVAGILFGLLALAWPDITQLVLAVVFGISATAYGLVCVAGAIRPTGAARRPAPVGTRPRRWLRTVRAVTALALALLLSAVSVTLHRASPRPDAFYRPPATVPTTPGALLRAEPFTRAIPAGSRAWRILYTTTRDERRPAIASGLVIAPQSPPPGRRPVIAWAHGTTGYAEGCAPSLLEDPFTAGATPALDQVIARGWIMVATDYVGLGTAGPHPYLIGQGEARSVLDAVRAARHLTEIHLSDTTLVWGHSQGGHAALWTGILAPTYAPDVPLAGVAAIAPASSLLGLVESLATVRGGSIFAAYVIQAYSDIYPDVAFGRYVRPTARIQIREMAARCLAEPEIFASVITSLLLGKRFFASDPATGALGQRLAANTPNAPIPAPLLIAQGQTDGLVTPHAQATYVRQRCAAGQPVDYRTYPGRDHVGVIAPDSPLIRELLQWSADRIAGRPSTPTCA